MRSHLPSLVWNPSAVAQAEAAQALPASPAAVETHATALSTPGRVRLVRACMRALTHARFAYAAIALALCLTAPALLLDLTADDHFHALAARGETGVQGVARAPWDIFAFAKNPTTNAQLVEEGVFPWWTDTGVVISFLRPLSSLTHYLDHALWDDHPVLMHAHSLLWFAALLGVVGLLYRTLSITPLACGLALLLYAIDDARAMPVGWVSNRNALVALVPALLGLYFHHRFRSENTARFAWFSVAFFALGLSGGEVALQVGGYLFAYALCFDTGSFKHRALSLLPFTLLVVAWRTLYSTLGYGAMGSDFYIDPGRNPLAFVAQLGVRLPVLLAAQLGGPFADFWDAYPVFAPALRVVVPLLGISMVALAYWLVKPLLHDRRIRFWATGAIVSTLPVCGASPSDRLLTATGIGTMAVIGHVLARYLEEPGHETRRFARLCAGTLAVFHLALAPMMLPFRTHGVNVMENLIVRAAQSLPGDAAIRGKTVVILNPPAEPFAGYLPLYQETNRLNRPEHLRWLTTGIRSFDIKRTGARTFEVRPEGGFLVNDVQYMFRSRARPMALGARVVLQDMTIEIAELTHDGRPAAITASFARPLDSEQFVFLQWGTHDYVPFAVPQLGQTVHVPAVDLKTALLSDPKASS